MKRRPHGVNLDDGVALASAEDFDRLHVAARPEEDRRLRGWLADPEAEALILAGQIGTGKTTLLNDPLRHAPGPGIVRVEFDKAPLEETQGAFLAVLFGALLTKALALKCSLEGLGLALSDFGSVGRRGWQGLRELLLVAPESVAKAARVRAAYGILDRNIQQAQKACIELIRRIESAMGTRLPIIAEGVDKFVISKAGYVALVEVLDFLSQYKTLYEANTVHLFDAGRAWVASQKLFIGPLADETILTMYEKRLGNYAPLYRDGFQMLVQFSGGNPRQALRLLSAYYSCRSKPGGDDASGVATAAHRVTQDSCSSGSFRFQPTCSPYSSGMATPKVACSHALRRHRMHVTSSITTGLSFGQLPPLVQHGGRFSLTPWCPMRLCGKKGARASGTGGRSALGKGPPG